MRIIDSFIKRIPKLLASRLSVYIYLLLFFYLVILGIVGLFFEGVEPPTSLQLIFGNYTNVLSAMGASLAAGFGYHHVKSLRNLHAKHDDLGRAVEQLHRKIDSLSDKPKR